MDDKMHLFGKKLIFGAKKHFIQNLSTFYFSKRIFTYLRAQILIKEIMAVNEIKKKYACTQDEWYAVSELAINNLEEDIDDFTTEDTNIDAAYVTWLRDLRAAAIALPNEEQRSARHETLRNLLPGLMEPIKTDFRRMQNYIRKGWPTEEPLPRYEAAGLIEYNAIGDNNWEHVVELNDMMEDFLAVAANVAKLTTPGGMPAGFAAQVTSNFNKFNDVYEPFMSSREQTVARNAKITADNVLYDACMDGFMKLAREVVYKNDSGKKKRYVFKTLKNLVSAPGDSSLMVTLKKPDDNVAAHIVVKVKKEGLPAKEIETDDKGEAKFMISGKCTVTVGDKMIKKEVKPGTHARLTIVVE